MQRRGRASTLLSVFPASFALALGGVGCDPYSDDQADQIGAAALAEDGAPFRINLSIGATPPLQPGAAIDVVPSEVSGTIS